MGVIQNYCIGCLIVLCYLSSKTRAGYAVAEGSMSVNCNRTWRASELQASQKSVIISSQISQADVKKPLKCWLEFQGMEGQAVMVRVRSVRAGNYDPNLRSCIYGGLKISDGSGDYSENNYPPSVLCGYYGLEGEARINLKRYSSQSSARVDFWVTLASTITGYDMEVTFVNIDSGLRRVREFGNYHTQAGRVPGTKCDWVINVAENCVKGCAVMSPGWPGIYPPNTRCLYYLTNFVQKRVKLGLGYGNKGKFDLQRSTDCSVDSVKVYDGNTTSSPMIGAFCGHDGGMFVSSGSSMVLEFQSQSGGPHWDYSGFDAEVVARWMMNPLGGVPLDNKVCDWVITADNATTVTGSINTPDHSISAGTECIYQFRALPNHHVTFEINIHKRSMTDNCNDVLEVWENGMKVEQYCSKNIKPERNELIYQSFGPNVTLRYRHKKGQRSNLYPIYIDYAFKPGARYFPYTRSPVLIQNVGDGGNAGVHVTSPRSLLLVWSLLLCSYYQNS